MTAIAMKSSAWDALSGEHREVVRSVLMRVRLGDPAVLEDESGDEWLVFDDPSISLEDVAVLGSLMKTPARMDGWAKRGQDGISVPANLPSLARERIQATLSRIDREAVASSDDPWVETLSQVTAPGALRASSGVPPGLTVAATEEQ